MKKLSKKQRMRDGLGLDRCWIPDNLFNSDNSNGLEGFYRDKNYMDKIKECEDMRNTGKGITVFS